MFRTIWEDLLEEKEFRWTSLATHQETSGSGGLTLTKGARPFYQSVSKLGFHVRNRHLGNIEEDALLRTGDEAQGLLQHGRVAQVATHEVIVLAPQQEAMVRPIPLGLDLGELGRELWCLEDGLTLQPGQFGKINIDKDGPGCAAMLWIASPALPGNNITKIAVSLAGQSGLRGLCV